MSAVTDKVWHLYVVLTADNFLYTGIATDVERRYAEHCAGGAKASRYLRAHRPVELVYRRLIGLRGLALKAEYRFKQLSRAEKDRLIRAGSLDLDETDGSLTPVVPG